jgi:periplasmic protein TonB
VYALEEEPESGNRWRRLGIGGLVSLVVLVGLGYGAQRFEPARRLLQKVVQMTVVVPDIPKDLPPPRTEPPPPPPKRQPPPQKSTSKAPEPQKTDTPQTESSDPVVGLDQGSFGAGNGASFQVGNTQMGDPTTIARAPALNPPSVPAAPPKLVPAGVPAQADRCRYSTRAQRLGLEGLLIIEVKIDERGQVTDAQVRKSIDDAEVDRECLEAVRASAFQPATLGGKPIASTRFLRLRFELER